MQFEQIKTNQFHQIHSYDTHQIIIGDQTYRESFIVTPRQILPWNIQSLDDEKAVDFLSKLDVKPEVVLFGTGETVGSVHLSCLKKLAEVRMGVEVMTIASAAASFNIMSFDGRLVAAAFFLKRLSNSEA